MTAIEMNYNVFRQKIGVILIPLFVRLDKLFLLLVIGSSFIRRKDSDVICWDSVHLAASLDILVHIFVCHKVTNTTILLLEN